MPSTSVSLSPLKLNLLLTKRAVGNLAALKKSSLNRCLLKGSTPVLIEPTSMVMSTLPVRAVRSNCTVPSFLSKRPRRVEVPMWPISKLAKVCVGSMA
jgi:hypothetical protein